MSPHFDPDMDAQALEKAMKGLGTDENVIIDILGNRTVEQRQKIADVYKACYGRDLLSRLKKELSGKFRKVVLASFFDRPHLHAYALFKAMAGMGTKERVIIQVVCTSNNADIADLRDAYEEGMQSTLPTFIPHGIKQIKKKLWLNEGLALRRNIEKDIRNDLSGDFEKFIVALLQGIRQQGVDQLAAEADADALYSAGEEKLGTDEEVFTRIFARRSYKTIRLLDELYFQKTGHDILHAIEKELSGDFKDAVKTVVKTAIKKEECIADMIRDSMKGVGTSDDDLIRLILAYAEASFIQKIWPKLRRYLRRKMVKRWRIGSRVMPMVIIPVSS
ncbi:Annexin A7 [Echinococcus granulosus]|uniref:Annexin A7 n=1 Tax=Echinococcus granulosus TaxID=6210 RepID=W6UNN7_ECHGR|nr:Annexin A7 [Echinococcus granulosus]EUB59907.1 Annexin A7 [Echinococcus granulosus]